MMAQREAIAELLALPQSHPYGQETLQHITMLQVRLKARRNKSRDLREVIMSLSPVYEEWLEKTLDEDRLQERRSLALKILRQEFDIQTIAQLTELSLEQVQQLQKASQTEL